MKTSLLPSNATPLEQALETVLRLPLDVAPLRGFKYRKEALALMFEDLIAEYGLKSVRRWVLNPALILTEGILFQRLRGTPSALKMALGWAGLDAVTITEEIPGRHFAEFQLGIESLPPGLTPETIVELVNQAKPVRSRLTRLYNSTYDRRHLILDENAYGDFLCGYSGVKVGDLVVSFGRSETYEANAGLGLSSETTQTRGRVWRTGYGGIFRLDEGILDEDLSELLEAAFIPEHAYILTTEAGVDGGLIPTTRSSAKAQLVLDDGFALGDENSALGPRRVIEVGQNLVLDDGLLDEQVWRQEVQEILERGTTFHKGAAAYENSPRVVVLTAHISVPMEAALDPTTRVVRKQSTLTHEATYGGVLFWHSWGHLDRPWSNEEPIVGRG